MARIVAELLGQASAGRVSPAALRRGHRPLRHRQAGPSLRTGDRRRHRLDWGADRAADVHRGARRGGHVIRVLRAPGRSGAAPAGGSTPSTTRRPGRRRGGGLAPAGPRRRDAGVAGPEAHADEASVLVVGGRAPSPATPCSCAVGPRAAAASLLGEQRTALGRELGLADPGVLSFCWVVDFPMYERNADTGDWDFSHNPFSMPQGGLEALHYAGSRRHPGLPVRPGVQRRGAVVRRRAQPPARGHGGGVRHRRLRP